MSTFQTSPARPPSGSAQEGDPLPTPGRGRFNPAASAVAIAAGIVSLHAAVFPNVPIARFAAILNEWIVWSVGLYLLLIGLTALSERAARPGGARVRSREATR
jgi:hypothetical protein